MSIDLSGLSAKELASLITQAQKRQTVISKRTPITKVRARILKFAKAEGLLDRGTVRRRQRRADPRQGRQEIADRRPQAGQGRAEVPEPGQQQGNLDRPRQAAALAGRAGRQRQEGRGFPDQVRQEIIRLPSHKQKRRHCRRFCFHAQSNRRARAPCAPRSADCRTAGRPPAPSGSAAPPAGSNPDCWPRWPDSSARAGWRYPAPA